jgi:molecular chaperone GrpE
MVELGAKTAHFVSLKRMSVSSTRGVMTEKITPSLQKWPFFLGDALLLGLAYLIFSRSRLPMTQWEMLFAVLCVLGGAVLSIAPFLIEYRHQMRLAETGALTDAVAQIQKLESLASQISNATGQWQFIQEQAEKAGASARGIADRMSGELKTFSEFLEKVDSKEKANLRLEIEKMRRSEAEWVQTLMFILDHTYALHVGALRSGQTKLIAQVTNFQNSCRDAARRVGISTFAAVASEPFDAQRHKAAEDTDNPQPGTLVKETLATGFTYQGRLIRPALVRLQPNGAPATADPSAPAASSPEAPSTDNTEPSVPTQEEIPTEPAPASVAGSHTPNPVS